MLQSLAVVYNCFSRTLGALPIAPIAGPRAFQAAQISTCSSVWIPKVGASSLQDSLQAVSFRSMSSVCLAPPCRVLPSLSSGQLVASGRSSSFERSFLGRALVIMPRRKAGPLPTASPLPQAKLEQPSTANSVHVTTTVVPGEQTVHASPGKRNLVTGKVGRAPKKPPVTTPLSVGALAGAPLSGSVVGEPVGRGKKGSRSTVVARSMTSSEVTVKTGVVGTSTGKRLRSAPRNVHSAAVRELLPDEKKLEEDDNCGLTRAQAAFLRAQIEKTFGPDESGLKSKGLGDSSPAGGVEETPKPKAKVSKKTVASTVGEVEEPVKAKGKGGRKAAQVVGASVPALESVENGVAPKAGKKKRPSKDASLEEPEETSNAGKVKRARKDAPNRVWRNGNTLSPWRSLPADVSVEVSTEISGMVEIVEDEVEISEPKAPKKRGGKKAAAEAAEQMASSENGAGIGDLAVKKPKRSRKAVVKPVLEEEEDGVVDDEDEPIEKPKRKRKPKQVMVKAEVEEEAGEEDELIEKPKSKRKPKAVKVKAEGVEDGGADEEEMTEEEKRAEEEKKAIRMEKARVRAAAKAAANEEAW